MMELTIHSGIGRETQPVEIHTYWLETGCMVTRYLFTDYNGAQLTVRYFKHGDKPSVKDAERS